MRVESSVTAVSWIPSDAIEGLPKIPFELGVGHYDEPPPDRLEQGDLERLREADRFREANLLSAWIEVEDGKVIDHGQDGAGLVGSTTFRFGPKNVVVPGVAFEILRPEPEARDDSVRFVQTVGGRAGFPAPRRVSGKPFIRIHSATAWTTLGLTIHADGSSEHELVGASPFPRHWLYDREGMLVQKAGTIDFKTWAKEAHGARTPWGDEESQAFVTEAESALERQLSRELMSGAVPKRQKLEPGETLVQQGDVGNELYLLLDGIVVVEVDGEEVAEIGPGAVLGELATLEGAGTRTATLRARTDCRVGIVPSELIDRAALEQLAAGRRRES